MSGEFAGTLTERIVIERPGVERSAAGLSSGTWERVATCLAAIELDGTGAEAEGQALSAMSRFKVTVRPREGLSVGQRVLWRGRAMMVRQLLDDPRRRDRMTLRCEEVRT